VGGLKMCLDEETIRDFFNKEQKKWELKKLIKKWKIDEADKEYFNDILKTLEEEGKIIIDEGRQMVMAFPKESNFLYGQIHINKSGNGLLEIDNKKYFVPSDCLEASLSGDMVIIEKYNQVNDGKILAVVRKVVKRKRDILVADYDGEELTLYGNKLNYPIKVNKEEEKRLEPGARVLLKIQKNLNDNVILGEVIKVIGNRDDLDLDLKTILAELEIPLDFSEESLKELETFPDEVLEEELANRIDFTNDPIVTIDCDNTKDMDDAVCVKKLDNGHYELDVHIADVGHYVKKDSALLRN
jgi:ribonuclease R